MGQSWSRWQKRRDARTLRELAPQKTPGHEEPLPELRRDTLVAALHNIAAYIAKEKQDVTIIAVGGAVNTIYLQSRVATHDVDFFNNNMTADDFGYLLNGAKEAAKRDSLLREQWFNNRTIFFIPMDQRAALTEQAYHQNEVIFRAQGLTVLAAPWQYALCCKLDRLAGSGLKNERRYDLNDAVQYLSRYLLKYRVAQVQKSELQAWFAQYSLRWTSASDAVIERLNAAYQAQFSESDCPIV